jgi:HD-like signal output (HDOD) protein
MVSRTKLETLMTPMGKCKTADCGATAIDLYEQSFAADKGYDLVMLDIDMPDMQGEEVLRKIRSIENYGPHRAAVVMVTAQSDQEHVLICLKSGCDEYIAKPFKLEIITEKLISLGLLEDPDPPEEGIVHTADSIFLEISKALRLGLFKLPVQPQIGIKFRDLVANNADVDQMAKLLQQDMIITARLIQMANSALYRGYGVVQTIERAIGRLGLAETEHLVIALSNQQMFDTDHPKYKTALQNLWQHSLASAYAADLLAGTLDKQLSIDPFCAGLFHDIGAMVLLKIIAQMEARGRYDYDVDAVALAETVASYHAIFGAKVLEMWGYDADYTRTTLSHNKLYTAESLTDELLIVHFSNLAAKSLGYTSDGLPGEIELTDAQSAKELQLGAPLIERLQTQVRERMEQSSTLID